ncbi:MAG: Ig-like domain-containing protein [Phycisphaerae bacterium]|nr:Ig-like domain-containing protein [Saprospiraceae bacterium]
MQYHFNPIKLRRSSRIVALIIYLLPLIALLASCARQGAPAGGPKDTKPPGIDTLASTPNFSTRFDKKRIEIKFDEWVVLSDAATQIVVSPPLAKPPEVMLKGKTVVVNFDKTEVLHPNTTYTVNFGTAVKDLHEGNPAKDLRFVFSTGDFIDSLSFTGVLVDAFTGDPVENVSIMLYENFADSAVRKEQPYYFSRTNKVGQYEFKNLRAGTFRVVAIEDGDLKNLKWDGENERIAFRDSALVVEDLMRGLIQLKLFKNQPKFRLLGQNANRYGLVKLGFNTPPQTVETQTIAPEGLITLTERTPDSLMLWYDLPNVDTAWTLLFSNFALRNRDSVAPIPRFDTIVIKKLSRSEFLKNHRIGFGDVAPPPPASGGKAKSIGPPPKPQAVKTLFQVASKPAPLQFNFPISAFDTSRWLLMVDSNRLTTFSVMPDSASPRRLSVALDWKQGKTYAIMLLPGALTDFWGTPNADTLLRNFNVLAEKQLGTLSLSLEKIRPGTSYVLQLLNGTTLEEERLFTAEAVIKKLIFKHLQVAVYSVRLIEDLNGNGRWDTGDFNTHRQPERVFNKKLDALRANWELEATFSTEAINEKKKKQGGG